MQAGGKLDAGKGGNRKSRSIDTTVKTLSRLKITKDESSRMQIACDVLEDDPDWFDQLGT
jgi:hypothetical protein